MQPKIWGRLCPRHIIVQKNPQSPVWRSHEEKYSIPYSYLMLYKTLKERKKETTRGGGEGGEGMWGRWQWADLVQKTWEYVSEAKLWVNFQVVRAGKATISWGLILFGRGWLTGWHQKLPISPHLSNKSPIAGKEDLTHSGPESQVMC